MSGLGSVVMASHLCAPVEGRFEGVGETILESLIDVARDLAPRVGNENDVLQGRVATKFMEHPEIMFGYLGELPLVGDAVDIDDPGKLGPSRIREV